MAALDKLSFEPKEHINLAYTQNDLDFALDFIYTCGKTEKPMTGG